jgi:osmotically-inducible protein OsmY
MVIDRKTGGQAMALTQPNALGSGSAAEIEPEGRAAIGQEIETALAVAGGLDAFHIDVSVESDQIILSGTVATTPEIARAIIVAEITAGERSISNRIVALE